MNMMYAAGSAAEGDHWKISIDADTTCDQHGSFPLTSEVKKGVSSGPRIHSSFLSTVRCAVDEAMLWSRREG